MRMHFSTGLAAAFSERSAGILASVFLFVVLSLGSRMVEAAPVGALADGTATANSGVLEPTARTDSRALPSAGSRSTDEILAASQQAIFSFGVRIVP